MLKSGGRWIFFLAGNELHRAGKAGGIAEGKEVLGSRTVTLAAKGLGQRKLNFDLPIGRCAFAITATNIRRGNGIEYFHGEPFVWGFIFGLLRGR